METPYTPAQKKGARIRIQKSLTSCYANEFRLGLLINSEECKVAMEMTREAGAQIVTEPLPRVDEKGRFYQYFAPKEDAMPHKGFKWNRGHKTNPRNY